MNDVPDPEKSRCELCSRVLHEVEDRIAAELERLRPRLADPQLVDIGCWDGEFTMRCAGAIGSSSVSGVEVYEAPARAAEARGVEVARVDLEAASLPWEDASADVLVCNQVLEHLKNIWLPMNEIHRVLRPGGFAVLSVPNLASLHNRILMGFGRQPTSTRVFGPHVRGYTFREFRILVERDGAFETERRLGAGFYPVPSPWSRPLSAIWPGASHTTVLVARKTSKRGPWLDYLEGAVEEGMQTFYGESAE
jgi:ubiquinone/menaquinone biosynthesis C-methylase UbiE